RRGPGRPGAVDVGAPPRLLPGRQAPLRLDLVLELRGRAEGGAGRAEEAEAAAAREGRARAGAAGADDALSSAGGRERLDQPGGRPRRPQRRGDDGAVHRPAVGEHGPGALDDVVEAEARAADAVAARVDEQAVVEERRRAEAGMRLEHERLDPLVAEALVAAGVALEELDARHLEPDEVGRVVGDPLRVGLGEADADEAERAPAVAQRPVEERAGELADAVAVVGSGREGRRPRPDREVGVAELRRDRAGGLAPLAQ